MSDCSREFRRAETLDDVISGYEVCMDEQVMEADSWLSNWTPQTESDLYRQLIYDNRDAMELLETTRTNVQGVTLAVSQQLAGVDGFPTEASQVMCDSWHQPDLAQGYGYIHRWTRDAKLLDALEASFDWYVLKNAFEADEIADGKRMISDFASSFGRQAMEMAFDEQVYLTANAQLDYDYGWSVLDTYISQNSTGAAARRGFDRYVFEAAKAQRAMTIAHLIIETCSSDDPDKRQQMLDGLESNVLILPSAASQKTRQGALVVEPSAGNAVVIDFRTGRNRNADFYSPDELMPNPDNTSW